MKICTIVGARPQFIKAAVVSRAIAIHNHPTPDTSRLAEVIVHTGQHYDEGMSDVFFRELGIPEPAYNLGIGSGSHGVQTGQMLAKIEDILLREKPDWVLIYGDTNSTLAGALSAAKLHIPIAHIEAGLRSFNRLMPEEINRVVADHLSDLLFCPSQVAVNNLASEGIIKGVTIVGDVMAEALKFASSKVQTNNEFMGKFKLKKNKFLLATIHRAENTDNKKRLENIIKALLELARKEPVILPLHPRTKKILDSEFASLIASHSSLRLIDPVGYFDMITLENAARMILTDSGGIQKEAYWLKVPCVTLRDETEWVETVQAGWNILTGAKKEKIINAVSNFTPPKQHPSLYGDDHAAEKIIKELGVRSKE